MYSLKNNNGFTMIELVIVIVIAGILSAVALSEFSEMVDTGRFEETRSEMDMLAIAITGNSELQNNGARSDYGYIGDVGSLPPNLNALVTNPGGYSTWNGPYVKDSYVQYTDDYKKDAWNVNYSYSGSTAIQSTGGSINIIRDIATSTGDLLYNTVSGNIYDLDGTPPGSVYKDSLTVSLTYPNGAGSMLTRGIYPDNGGYFNLDSIPIGSHILQAIYLPDNDTLVNFIAVDIASDPYVVLKLSTDYWQ